MIGEGNYQEVEVWVRVNTHFAEAKGYCPTTEDHTARFAPDPRAKIRRYRMSFQNMGMPHSYKQAQQAFVRAHSRDAKQDIYLAEHVPGCKDFAAVWVPGTNPRWMNERSRSCAGLLGCIGCYRDAAMYYCDSGQITIEKKALDFQQTHFHQRDDGYS